MADTTPPIPDGSVVITPTQQYNELRALTKAVEALTAKVDPTLVGLRQDVDEQGRGLDDERRERRHDVEKLSADIGALKQWRSAITGALVLLSLLVGWGVINAKVLGG